MRTYLPRLSDRLRLGRSGLAVSPACIGITGSSDTVPAAYEQGINFFFLSADLHWPLYEHTRRGLQCLLAGSKGIRDTIVVGVVSYLDEPLFRFLQFHEVIQSVPGLERIDLLIAGAVSSHYNAFPRYQSMASARHRGDLQSSAIGATFHSRAQALASLQQDLLDISYIRYNARHAGANQDIFPFSPPNRAGLVFSFKSTMFHVGAQALDQLGISHHAWRPAITDSYRFVLSNPYIDGILASPMTPAQVSDLAAALNKGPLSPEEQQYMMCLAAGAYPRRPEF